MEYKIDRWTKLLHYVAWIILLSGIFYGLIVPYFIPELLDIYLNEFNSDILLNSISNGPKTLIYFLFGVMGAIMFGWGILMVFVTKQLYIKDESWIRKAIVISTFGWFIFDSLFSIIIGTVINIFFNLVFLALLLFPIIGYYYSSWKSVETLKSLSMEGF